MCHFVDGRDQNRVNFDNRIGKLWAFNFSFSCEEEGCCGKRVLFSAAYCALLCRSDRVRIRMRIRERMVSSFVVVLLQLTITIICAVVRPPQCSGGSCVACGVVGQR